MDRWRATANTLLTRHRTGSLVAWGLACVTALVGLALPLPYLHELQATDLELMMRMQEVIEPHAPEGRLAVARIDAAAERAAKESWPWSKATLARAVDGLAAGRPRAIVLACLYHEAPLLDIKAGDPLGLAVARAGNVIVPARPGTSGAGYEDVAELDGLTQLVRLWKPAAPAAQLSWTAQALIAAAGPGAEVDVSPHRMRIGGLKVPAREGVFRVHPGLLGAIKQVSLAQVLTGTLERDELKDRVVLVGVTTAAWPPVPLTPSRAVSTVELHALAITTALRGMALRRTGDWVTGLLMLLTLLYTVPIVYAPRGRRAIMIVKVATVLLMVPVLALHWASVEIDVARPIVMFLMALPATASLRLAERRPARAARTGPDIDMGDGEPADVMRELVERYLGDRFCEMRPIGHGGMGTVFRARCRRLDAEVALKVLHPPHAQNRAVVERFFREYELGEKLVHPGFVRVFERGQAGLHYFTMELLPGPTLADELEDGRRFSWSEAARLLGDLAAPLKYAHGLGVLHRDLKPGNVMRVSGGVKVLDLGVARMQEASALTGSGEVMGTLRYMAPEQIEGQPASPAVDVFAAGTLAWEMATGELPFDPYDMTRRFRMPEGIVSGAVPPAPPRLLALLTACVAAAPADRPADFGAVMVELNKVET